MTSTHNQVGNNQVSNKQVTNRGITINDVPPQSEGFTFNHTMLRVKDPAKSLEFYTQILGMTLLHIKRFPEMQFDLYFLAKLSEAERQSLPNTEDELAIYTFRQRGILELTHNYGTESQSDFNYHNGNSEPQGFGHICFSVPNFEQAIAWLDENSVQYIKRPEDGKMKNVAFIKDIDGYWIEVVQAENMV
ncbi:MAG: lactoylglutathione lyase [Pseudomonadales bacterium]|nr:MAG: lactoylglutathione lyase [Pseudomonadales bacterium]